MPRPLLVIAAILPGLLLLPPTAAKPRGTRGPAPPSIAFLKPVGDARMSELWTANAIGANARRIAFAGDAFDLSSGPAGFVWIADQCVHLFRPGRDRTPKVLAQGQYVGQACWLPGGSRFLLGRGAGDAGVDDGLWLLGAGLGRPRRLLKPLKDVDIAACSMNLLSPGGTRVAVGGGVDDFMWLRVLDRRTWRPLWRLPDGAGDGVFDFAWLDEDHLLLACGVSYFAPERSRHGIWRVDLRTGRLTPWLFAGRRECKAVERAPDGRTFAVEFGGSGITSPDRGGGVALADRRSRAIRTLFRGASVAGFSPDSRRILLLVQRGKNDDRRGHAVIINLADHSSRTVARDVLEAVWVAPPQLARASGAGAATSRAISPVARR
jgi:hypothetical protein